MTVKAVNYIVTLVGDEQQLKDGHTSLNIVLNAVVGAEVRFAKLPESEEFKLELLELHKKYLKKG